VLNEKAPVPSSILKFRPILTLFLYKMLKASLTDVDLSLQDYGKSIIMHFHQIRTDAISCKLTLKICLIFEAFKIFYRKSFKMVLQTKNAQRQLSTLSKMTLSRMAFCRILCRLAFNRILMFTSTLTRTIYYAVCCSVRCHYVRSQLIGQKSTSLNSTHG
jgi:hypothetical protein